MIIPFNQDLFRNRWFAATLVAIAVSLWIDAISQIREIRMKVNTRDAISELQQICAEIAEKDL